MFENQTVARRSAESVLTTNRVLRNTYALLSLTLLFSSVTAGVSMAIHAPPMAYLLSIGASFLLLWLVLPRTENSSAGIWVVFAVTGLLGFGLGPILNLYMALANGPQLIMTALGGTGVIFLGLSGYVLTTRKDFSFLGGFLALSSAVILIMSGFILFDTSRIIHGGETNYIRATVGLYLNIYNIFINLLSLLGALSGDDR